MINLLYIILIAMLAINIQVMSWTVSIRPAKTCNGMWKD